MASTPSTAALSAVLRCPGTIWTRSPSNKRPVASGCSLGLAAGALRDSPTERTRSSQTSAWEAFLREDRVVVGRKLTVVYKSARVDGNMLREKDFRGINDFIYPKPSPSTGHAHPCAQSVLVRQLTRGLIFKLPGVDRCFKVIHMINCEKYAGHICNLAVVQEARVFPCGVLKVSITSPRWMEHAGHLMKTLKSTCISLTALVSEMMWSTNNSPSGASQVLCLQDEKSFKHNVLQVRLNKKKHDLR